MNVTSLTVAVVEKYNQMLTSGLNDILFHEKKLYDPEKYFDSFISYISAILNKKSYGS